MDRQEYNQCMSPFIRGKDKTPEKRKADFCIGAKICSGKASTEEEARQICLSAPPKEPKTRKRRSKADCPKEMAELANCVAPLLDINVETLTKVLQKCACGVVPRKTVVMDPKTQANVEKWNSHAKGQRV